MGFQWYPSTRSKSPSPWQQNVHRYIHCWQNIFFIVWECSDNSRICGCSSGKFAMYCDVFWSRLRQASENLRSARLFGHHERFGFLLRGRLVSLKSCKTLECRVRVHLAPKPISWTPEALCLSGEAIQVWIPSMSPLRHISHSVYCMHGKVQERVSTFL